jgi:hypothetical protein
LYGYTGVYKFTREPRFLDAACRIADYFVSRVDADGVVYWDFDAPRPGVWDVSAGMCACSGMLLLVQLRPELGDRYLAHALRILDAAMRRAPGREGGDALLDHSTMNDYEHALNRTADHGLVYADYYFVEAGNRLLDMALDENRAGQVFW